MKLLNDHGVNVSESDFKSDLKEALLAHLHRRKLIETCVNEEQLEKAIQTRKLGLYCGADPTAKSLHLGNLLPLMILLHFNIRGHNIFPLVGGATGAVGDPSGRNTERNAMSDNARLDHVKRIADQFLNFFSTALKYSQSRNPLIEYAETGSRQLKDNYEWWKDMGMLEFLAMFGRYFRVNQMLARDSIKSRLLSEQGIGFNEFTYQILQAYDFYYLNKNFGVDIQVGGRDQYGNIVAGIDLITRLGRHEENKDQGLELDLEQESKSNLESQPSCYGLTVPLLTTASGVKFGKSAGNAIFIDRELTPSYEIYQFMYRTEDEDVQRFLYKFSMLPIPVIDRIVQAHDTDRKQRFGQRVLAMEMCDLIHGDGEGYDNELISKTLYSKELNIKFDTDELLRALKRQNMVTTLTRKQLAKTNATHLLFTLSKGAHSKSDFRRKIKSRAIIIGRNKKEKINAVDEIIKRNRLIDDKLLLLRAGKEYYIAEVVED
ncbi:hypothetical protein FOA43_000209 [Brettanomyces nanus]|uniref:Tyrosine--tRNA ligase n=1 Tax=Eeniella nana TaxID=13502 RepID=A0A875RW23_EENNA|nr:uncharacterized protein FOA43_000209 [Brettanomyces nanus]QPG72906.1 hypothetical protein FOA43_000209 [Brettanomyces nanus]